MFRNVFANKRVWISGTTGFKGSWLAEWLLRLGADIHALALPPHTTPSLFDLLNLRDRLHQTYGDIRDQGVVRRSLEAADPDYVFHLAAQALVRDSYALPVETFDTNVMGVVHILETLRSHRKRCAVVMVTTDKCYENHEWLYGYRESDPLGGRDPYSASKAAAEMAIAAYRRSFFKGHPVRIASARAGNVIGGGDWSANRILPDCIRALSRGAPIPVRNPSATRPWQHVLEPLGGYLWLAALLGDVADDARDTYETEVNFGPGAESNRTVRDLVQEVLTVWPGAWEDRSDPEAAPEATLLHLSIDKAYALLGWRPGWDFTTAVHQSVTWYRSASMGLQAGEIQVLTGRQISDYENRGRELKLPWAVAKTS